MERRGYEPTPGLGATGDQDNHSDGFGGNQRAGAGGAALDRAIDDVLSNFAAGRLIFNLGHGILPETPIAHVEQMVKRVRG